jgi:hypothetical protein
LSLLLGVHSKEELEEKYKKANEDRRLSRFGHFSYYGVDRLMNLSGLDTSRTVIRIA